MKFGGIHICSTADVPLPEGAPLTEEEIALFGAFRSRDQDASSLPKDQDFSGKECAEMCDVQPDDAEAPLSYLSSETLDSFGEGEQDFDTPLPEGEESLFPILELCAEEDTDMSVFDAPLPEGELCDNPLLELIGTGCFRHARSEP